MTRYAIYGDISCDYVTEESPLFVVACLCSVLSSQNDDGPSEDDVQDDFCFKLAVSDSDGGVHLVWLLLVLVCAAVGYPHPSDPPALPTKSSLMAQQRRPSQRVSSAIDNSLLARRKLQNRRGQVSRRRVFTITGSLHQPPSNSHGSVASSVSPPDSPRPVLVPVHFNLRRLPSRVFVEEDREEEDMHDAVQAGAKRKRVVSGSENGLVNGRGSRAGHRVKRRRGLRGSSEEDEDSSMEIDDTSRSDEGESDNNDDDVAECKS